MNLPETLLHERCFSSVSFARKMFSRLSYLTKRLYIKTTTSIAFYPALLALMMLALAWGCMYIDALGLGRGYVQWISFLSVRDPETARSLLSTLAGGLISLMVFSFSMVMVVLNQAAANFSPRVLPGLVSRREHQIVLGIYLGTIAYTLAVLSNVQSETFEVAVPRFSIIVNIFLGLLCFTAFIYFIHEISTVIQVGNILKRLYKATRQNLIRELSGGNYTEEALPFGDWYHVKAWQSGYFFKVAETSFRKEAANLGLQVRLLKRQGDYLLKGEEFLVLSQAPDEEVLNSLMENFIFQNQELIYVNYYYGFKQISEIAVKALSPGINDPGTALQAIHFLTDLFYMLMRLDGQKVLRHKDGTAFLIYLPVAFEDIFYLSAGSIRNYALQDVAVLAEMIRMIEKLRARDQKGSFEALFSSELEALKESSSEVLKSRKDREYIINL